MKKGLAGLLVVFGMALGSLMTVVLNPIGAAGALVGASGTSSSAHESVLQQALDALVGKGTITKSQATAVTNQVHSLQQAHPHGFGMGMGPGALGMGMGMGHDVMGDLTALTTLLKTDPQTLFSDIRSGQSIADIAKAKGVDLKTVEQTLVADATKELNQAVTNGWLTKAQATDLESKLPSEIDKTVNQKFTMGAFGMGFGHGHPGFKPGSFPGDPGAPGTPAKPGAGSTTTTTH